MMAGDCSQAAAVSFDAREASAGRCPSAALPPASDRILRSLAPECAAHGLDRASLAAQLAEVQPRVNVSEGCRPADAADSDRRCALTHDEGISDGLGAQMYRRLTVFIGALQLGCHFIHSPLHDGELNHKHGVNLQEAEAFFSLGLECPRAQPPWSDPHCRHPSHTLCKKPQLCTVPDDLLPPDFAGSVGRTVETQPLEVTHASLAPSCDKGSVGQLLTTWADRMTGQLTRCRLLYVPPIERCTWLRGVAVLRRRYELGGGGGTMGLPWFARREDARALAAPPPLALQVALHVRRGDLSAPHAQHQRLVANPTLTLLLSSLVSRLDEVCERWPSPLAVHLHVLSQSDWLPGEHHTASSANMTTPEPLPEAAWRSLLGEHNISLSMHIDDDALLSLRHMIAADVLIAGPSNFAHVAAMYSDGVKIYYPSSGESDLDGGSKGLFLQAVSSASLEQPEGARSFVCKLLSHLLWRARRDRRSSLD